MSSTKDFQVIAKNDAALFTLKLHRGEGMLLLAMDWKQGEPPEDFVGFSIEYKEPGGSKFYPLQNLLSFPDKNGKVSNKSTSSLIAPFQKFRWIHFPYNAELDGDFIYKVKPVFMDSNDDLSYGVSQEASIQLKRETYENELNVTFTRGFVSSQSFVKNFGSDGDISKLLPDIAKKGLTFTPTYSKKDKAFSWMGFEARKVILELLDEAIADPTAEVRVVAYDLNEPEIVDRLKKLGDRVHIIIDNSKDHGDSDSAESQAEAILLKSSNGHVKRHHMSQLQHNKMIIVSGNINKVICGSTNFSWRGFYVQANNAVEIYGEDVIKPFIDAFENYMKFDSTKTFGPTNSAKWNPLPLTNIDARVSFSPHSSDNALLDEIANDMEPGTKSSLLYSLAFLYETKGSIRTAVENLTKNDSIFVYGISDKKVGGLIVQKPDGNLAPVYPTELSGSLPEPFKSEPTGGSGTRMHHKFVVIDFNTTDARVYLGSYNFSDPADTKNGENLLLIKDRRIATSYMIEALRLCDHYHFRVAMKENKKINKPFCLLKPPRNNNELPWWSEYYTNARKIRDRELFSK